MESPPSLEEEAAMTEPFAGREPYYDGEYDEPPSWYPADDDDEVYPGSDDFPAYDDDGDYVPYGPADPNFNGYDPDETDGLDEDWPTTPDDWRHGEPAGDEGWS